MKNVGKVLVGGTVAAALMFGAGCSKLSEQYKDAPKGARNSGPADIWTMPDGFSNGSDKCDHGNRVYVIFHEDSNYGAIAVVKGDPTCATN